MFAVLDDCDRHIINQLRKVIDLHGKYEVIFLSGERMYISPEDANKALDKYEFARTTIMKNEISDKLFESLESFNKEIGKEYINAS